MNIRKTMFLLLALWPAYAAAQSGKPEASDGLTVLPSEKSAASYKPLLFALNADKSQYIRFLLWHQQWITTGNLRNPAEAKQLHHAIRRMRFLSYAQLHPDVLILTHWGLNNLDAGAMNAVGSDGDGPQLFLHDAWTEFRVSRHVFVGGGLHYYRGLTRLSSQSTLNFTGLDQPRPFAHWSTLGITDQFVRHMGFYLKGEFDRLAYRFSWNNPIRKPLNGGASYGDKETSWRYNSINVQALNGSRSGNSLYEGYVNWFFLEKESTKLPYWVGSYLGTKRVLNAGAGFIWHPDGMVSIDSVRRRPVFHAAADVFADLPLGKETSVTWYASAIRFNYGPNYVSRWAGTGWNFFMQGGPYFKSLRLMPYAAVQTGLYEGLNRPVWAMDAGINYFIMDHHAKISLEYHSVRNFQPEGGRLPNGDPRGLSQVRFQMHVFF